MSVEVHTELPILLLGSLNEIRTSTRLEKMAFLCDQKIFKDGDGMYYTDWKPHHYGPYSKKLMDDVNFYATKLQRIIEIRLVEDVFSNIVKMYSLTIKGRHEFSKLLNKFDGKQFDIYELLLKYQKHKTNYKLLHDVYDEYPKYTVNSLIKNKVM